VLVGRPAGFQIDVKEFTTSEADLLADLNDADLVLMPSIYEDFGLVASEAVRAGKPVLVGEGTGAGRFFADPQHVPPDLGEPVVVRDRNAVPKLRQAAAAVAAADGKAWATT
jgi:glycosyltransferase involved in cell wall biosynthesis